MKIMLSRLSILWLLLFGVVALASAIVIHSGFHVSWSDLAPTMILAVGIQWVAWEAMSWARRKFRPRNDPRPSILIAGTYCAALISLGMYCVETWRLVDLGRDRFYLPVFTLVGTIFVVCLLSFRRIR